MSEDANRYLVARYYEGFIRNGQLDAAQLFDPHPTLISSPDADTRNVLTDVAEIQQAIDALRLRMPDLSCELGDLAVHGDEVTAQVVFRGTYHTGIVGGGPTGGPVAFRISETFRLHDEHIVEQHSRLEGPDLIEQLGLGSEDDIEPIMGFQPYPGYPPIVKPPRPRPRPSMP